VDAGASGLDLLLCGDRGCASKLGDHMGVGREEHLRADFKPRINRNGGTITSTEQAA